MCLLELEALVYRYPGRAELALAGASSSIATPAGPSWPWPARR